jgi:hypothetical protein
MKISFKFLKQSYKNFYSACILTIIGLSFLYLSYNIYPIILTIIVSIIAMFAGFVMIYGAVRLFTKED